MRLHLQWVVAPTMSRSLGAICFTIRLGLQQILVHLQKTEKFYATEKWTSKVGQQYKKYASSPVRYERTLTISGLKQRVFCCLSYDLPKITPGYVRQQDNIQH